jgi:hypothetical protein
MLAPLVSPFTRLWRAALAKADGAYPSKPVGEEGCFPLPAGSVFIIYHTFSNFQLLSNIFINFFFPLRNMPYWVIVDFLMVNILSSLRSIPQ